jgi:Mg-chelatase subunit ChlD
VPTIAELDTVVRDVRLSTEPSRLLAVIDVSGSMAQQVAGTAGASRLDLARAAAIRGLGLYSADSAIGLWEFSRHLLGSNDYRQIAAVAPLGAESGGSTGAQRIGGALQQLHVVPDGGTGLYDTTLAAVRLMRATWDPHRVNTVLLLTDGRNDDQGSISADQLVATLRAEADPARPVVVVSIAFGPDSDIDILSRISAATGGTTYQSIDPRQIGEIFLDSVGQRLCRPKC